MPPPRYDAALWYNPDLDVVYMHGGIGTSTILHDTWSWDGTDWTELFPATSPPPATFFEPQFGAVYSPDLGYSLMFGETSTVTQTWKWDGTDWTLLAPTHQPAIAGQLMVSAANSTILLFGAHGVSPPDTYLWSGTDWLVQSPVNHPTSTGFESWIPGGAPYIWANSGSPPASEWLWDGTDWISQGSTGSPPASTHAANAAYFGVTGGLIGANFPNATASLVYTAHYDPVAKTWVDLMPIVSPSNRGSDQQVVQNVGGQTVLLFGGFDQNTNHPFGDTWVLVPVPPDAPFLSAHFSTV